MAKASGRPVQVRNVSLSRGKDGFHVEIAASGAVTPKIMKLTSPDRIVIDIPNSVPATRREIAVNNGTVKSIRMSRYSLNPPATRVVVDLVAPKDYEVANTGSRLTLKLHNVALAETSAPVPAHVPVAVPVVEPANLAVVPAQTSPVVPAVSEGTKTVSSTPTERAAAAASHFATPSTDIPTTNANASMTVQPALNMAMLQQQQQQAAAAAAVPVAQQVGSGSCGGGRYNGEPISVNLKDVDLRDFFRLVHDISGLNVVLDPQVRGSLTMVLDDVPWDQALQIVLKNNQLDCELQGNVLRIATTATMKKEADDRKAQIDAQALAVDMTTINRYLSYAVAKDVVPTLKAFLSSRGSIIADERTNSLVISDIPNVIPNVDRLIKELDKKTQEVEIEARVVAANRSFARDIGTQIGFGIGSQNGITTAIGGSAQVGSSGLNAPIPLGLINTGSTNGNGPIPLFSNLPAVGPTSGLIFNNIGARYRVDAILTMAESRGLIKILSRPRVVTQNNIPAVVKQGVRIPIVTLAQLGGPPTTTYVEAYLRLSVKPQITAEGTIFLNVDVENTTADFSRQVQGNPTLVTEQATTQVLITDGGTVVIGGVIQTNNNVGIQQVPLLGNIPVLGNLFKRRTVSTSVQELIFFITPKIVQT